jgi:hypothetical protein
MGDENGKLGYEPPRIQEIGTLHDLTKAIATVKVNTQMIDTFGTSNIVVQTS